MKDLFTETEISWNNKCWQCKKKKKHTKQLRIYNINNYFIISLQRNDNSRINCTNLHFSPSINLNDYIDKDIFKGKFLYRLKGSINHIGSINFGHIFVI